MFHNHLITGINATETKKESLKESKAGVSAENLMLIICSVILLMAVVVGITYTILLHCDKGESIFLYTSTVAKMADEESMDDRFEELDEEDE